MTDPMERDPSVGPGRESTKTLATCYQKYRKLQQQQLLFSAGQPSNNSFTVSCLCFAEIRIFLSINLFRSTFSEYFLSFVAEFLSSCDWGVREWVLCTIGPLCSEQPGTTQPTFLFKFLTLSHRNTCQIFLGLSAHPTPVDIISEQKKYFA